MKEGFSLAEFKVGSVPGKSVVLVTSKKNQNPSWVWCKAINKVMTVMLLIVLFINKAA